MAGTKRKEVDDPDHLYSNKSRSRPSVVEGRVDPTYGQRSALPGLDDETTALWEDDSFNYDDTSLEALNYLRSVRQEATAIPNLLVAPREPTDVNHQDYYEDGDVDYASYYEDGAYYTSDPGPVAPDTVAGDGGTDMDPRLAYFDSILSRFEKLRTQLHQMPPQEVVAKLGPAYPIIPPPKAMKSHLVTKWWRGQIQSMNPAPAQVASMDKNNVLRALGSLIGGKLLRSGFDIKPSVSLWIWSLLARLPEKGELSSEEIGVVRELGKSAILIGIGINGERGWQEGMQEVQAGLDEESDEDEETHVVNDEEIQLDIDETFDDGTEMDIGVTHDATHQPSNPARQIDLQLPGQDNAQEVKLGEDQDRFEAPKLSSDKPLISITKEDRTPLDESCQDSEAQINAAKARILARLSSGPDEHENNIGPEAEIPSEKANDIQPSKCNTRATVDMIITIAGEMYGQRDLLEFRPKWDD